MNVSFLLLAGLVILLLAVMQRNFRRMPSFFVAAVIVAFLLQTSWSWFVDGYSRFLEIYPLWSFEYLIAAFTPLAFLKLLIFFWIVLVAYAAVLFVALFSISLASGNAYRIKTLVHRLFSETLGIGLWSFLLTSGLFFVAEFPPPMAFMDFSELFFAVMFLFTLSVALQWSKRSAMDTPKRFFEVSYSLVLLMLIAHVGFSALEGFEAMFLFFLLMLLSGFQIVGLSGSFKKQRLMTVLSMALILLFFFLWIAESFLLLFFLFFAAYFVLFAVIDKKN